MIRAVACSNNMLNCLIFSNSHFIFCLWVILSRMICNLSFNLFSISKNEKFSFIKSFTHDTSELLATKEDLHPREGQLSASPLIPSSNRETITLLGCGNRCSPTCPTFRRVLAATSRLFILFVYHPPFPTKFMCVCRLLHVETYMGRFGSIKADHGNLSTGIVY